MSAYTMSVQNVFVITIIYISMLATFCDSVIGSDSWQANYSHTGSHKVI